MGGASERASLIRILRLNALREVVLGYCNEKRPALMADLRSEGFKIGRGERIRTSDHLHPIQVRYQAALHPER